MADRINRELGVPVEILVGKSGEFTVWVGDRCVAKKTLMGFPDDEECLDSVREAMGN